VGFKNLTAFLHLGDDVESIPSFPAFERLAVKGNLIPVYKEFLADTETPVSAYLKIRNGSFSFLLESAEFGKRWGRYSFIGYDPFLVVFVRDQEMEIRNGSRETSLKSVENPFAVLRELNRKFRPAGGREDLLFPGGLVGFCNYDLVRKWEPTGGCSTSGQDGPESIFMAPGRLMVFDHLTHRMKVVVLVHLEDGDNRRREYEQALKKIDETMAELTASLHAQPSDEPLSVSQLVSSVSKREFEEAVRKAKDYIIAGDVIQVVLSQRFSGDVSGDPFILYRTLRSINPSPYMFYLHFGDTKLIGASPEVLVRLTDRKIDLRPIAGTRPRGATTEEDEALEKELMADPKERAEHIMLVDLGRNDVGRVAMPGSVEVSGFMEVERYSHVMHIVSHVQGELKPELDCFDLFMSAFPAGTVTGAPKVRAMQIIEELEPCTRGPYAGAVGYFGFNGNMDFCITIRTITIANNSASIQVGAGIVYDSSPEKEYEETLRKAAGMFKAIERAQEQ
jgi:anthranilate synthase component 1